MNFSFETENNELLRSKCCFSLLYICHNAHFCRLPRQSAQMYTSPFIRKWINMSVNLNWLCVCRFIHLKFIKAFKRFEQNILLLFFQHKHSREEIRKRESFVIELSTFCIICIYSTLFWFLCEFTAFLKWLKIFNSYEIQPISYTPDFDFLFHSHIFILFSSYSLYLISLKFSYLQMKSNSYLLFCLSKIKFLIMMHPHQNGMFS